VEVHEAVTQLGVRPGACPEEVRRAFRSRVRELRPDLPGRTSGLVTPMLKEAREVLLAEAGPDRRGARRATGASDMTPLRRSTWHPDALEPRRVDVRL
jgi:hypothetical protein